MEEELHKLRDAMRELDQLADHSALPGEGSLREGSCHPGAGGVLQPRRLHGVAARGPGDSHGAMSSNPAGQLSANHGHAQSPG